MKVTENIEFIYNMACNMGGMGFIENNKAECMLSVLINTNLLRASLTNKIKKYFFLQVHVFTMLQSKRGIYRAFKEEDAYPADPEDG